MDEYLAAHDVIGSLAHIQMLNRIGLLTDEELSPLQTALRKIYTQTQDGTFTLSENVEDIHSQVEGLLTEELGECLEMTTYMLGAATIKKDLLNDPKYDHLFSVEAVNRLVQTGVPFRDAYKQVGHSIEAGTYLPERTLNLTHEGSMGRLCNSEIAAQYQLIRDRFPFQQIREQLARLLTGG